MQRVAARFRRASFGRATGADPEMSNVHCGLHRVCDRSGSFSFNCGVSTARDADFVRGYAWLSSGAMCSSNRACQAGGELVPLPFIPRDRACTFRP